MSETPGTQLGRSDPLIAKPPGTDPFERVMVMLKGSPVCAVAIVLSVQPPNIVRAIPGLLR